jgi:hypothetical protein
MNMQQVALAMRAERDARLHVVSCYFIYSLGEAEQRSLCNG